MLPPPTKPEVEIEDVNHPALGPVRAEADNSVIYRRDAAAAAAVSAAIGRRQRTQMAAWDLIGLILNFCSDSIRALIASGPAGQATTSRDVRAWLPADLLSNW